MQRDPSNYQCCHPPPVSYTLPPPIHSTVLGAFGWWVPTDNRSGFPNIPRFWPAAHHCPELSGLDDILSSAWASRPPAFGRTIFPSTVPTYRLAREMMHRLVDEDFLQVNPDVAVIGRATVQFASRLLTLERYHEYQEHERAVIPAAGAIDKAPSKEFLSENGQVVAVQGESWPLILAWTTGAPPSGNTPPPRPMFTCLGGDELVVEGLQPDDGAVVREPAFVLAPCQHTIGKRCFKALLESVRADRKLANEPLKCPFCSVNVSSESVRMLEAGRKLA
ncbi:hypothetical protein VP1G_06772 [Cytospora mali]|uniref:Uncharacterized protein n=1 Tax=Cytospora mali TaxID=578113 RepID=A0A194V6G3_CYTMA|nr:hypothetical protein VP1G_06772 [Valsa mali var. pyri (nom. inval.)]